MRMLHTIQKSALNASESGMKSVRLICLVECSRGEFQPVGYHVITPALSS